MLGDGRLPLYGSEQIGELFYKARVARTLWLTMDYQFVPTPATTPTGGRFIWWPCGHTWSFEPTTHCFQQMAALATAALLYYNPCGRLLRPATGVE